MASMGAGFDVSDDDEEDVSFNISQLEGVIGTIRMLADGIGGRHTWRQVKGVRRATEEASRLMSKIGAGSPPQAADFAATELGLV